jgi:hypothetical protein
MPKKPAAPRPPDAVPGIVPKPPTAEDLRQMTDPVGWVTKRYPEAADRIMNRTRKGR